MAKSKPRILVVDDEKHITDALGVLLEHAGYNVSTAHDGRTALRRVQAEQPDLIILDVRIPELDGYEVLQRLSQEYDIPVIMLTALTQPAAHVKGMDLGAEDFFTKPFDNDQLLAHIRARMRPRGRQVREVAKRRKPYAVDQNLTIDFAKHRVLVRGAPVDLTPTEWRIFERLVRAKGAVVPFQTLLRAGWDDTHRDKRALKVQLSHIRKKLSDPVRRPHYVHTHRELGYSFQPRQG